MDATPLLEVKKLTKIYAMASGIFARGGNVCAVDNVSLTLRGGQSTLLTIVGESGSGKTTLARMILGLTPPSSGEILFRGRSTTQMSRQERNEYRKEVQAVFQDPYGTYNPFYRIDRVLTLPIRKFGLASGADESRRLTEEALKAVDLRPEDTIGRFPHQLSGGERQRIMLARLYLLRPQLIVADEPVSMLDVSLRAGFLNILLDFGNQYGMSCIFITHNLATAYYLGGQIMILCDGRVAERGSMDAVMHNPLHPYTRLLIASIPPPNPKNRWTDTLDWEVGIKRRTAEISRGCTYRNRCPQCMDQCGARPPTLEEVEPGHEVACYLYGK